jgi:hypothetical protein
MEKKIIETKEEARQFAVDYQNWASEENMYYSDLLVWSDYFEELGRKFGLLREFKENGII